MSKRLTMRRWLDHIFLMMGLVFLFLPLYLALVAASHSAEALTSATVPGLPGSDFWYNLKKIFTEGLAATGGEPITRMLLNSFVMAFMIALGKVILAITSAFALVYFEFPFKKACFALIFLTMMLPVEVRIVPTFQVAASLGWLNSFPGLTLPLVASATATFLFRQFFKTVPRELVEAAKLDGAGPLRFFCDMLLPLSLSHMAALFVIMFIYISGPWW